MARRPKGSTTCSRGHEYTPENTYFYPHKPNSRVCRTCRRRFNDIYNRDKGHSSNWRQFHFTYRYGITLEDYKQMLEKQEGVCAICSKVNNEVIKSTGQPRSLHVDHCHTTGKIRGLLCGGCNKSLGQFKESPELLEKAAQYLRERS